MTGIWTTSSRSPTSLTKPAEMPIADLKPYHVVQWADRHTSWGANYRRGAIVAIQRPMNWAVKLGYITSFADSLYREATADPP